MVVIVMVIVEEAGLAVEEEEEVDGLRHTRDQAGGLRHMREEDKQVAAGLPEKEKDLFLTRENAAAAPHLVAEKSPEERMRGALDQDPDLKITGRSFTHWELGQRANFYIFFARI